MSLTLKGRQWEDPEEVTSWPEAERQGWIQAPQAEATAGTVMTTEKYKPMQGAKARGYEAGKMAVGFLSHQPLLRFHLSPTKWCNQSHPSRLFTSPFLFTTPFV